MTSGSKRPKFPAFFRKSFSLGKKGRSASSEIHNDTSTTFSVAPSSNAVVDGSSPGTSALKIVMSGSPPPATGIQPSSSGGFFANASYFTMNNPVMMDNTTVNIHDASDRKGKAMERLSEHMIRGAAHDSSARHPPPRCHPGTRIKINEHIITWFYDEEKQELFLWVYGPAGVGKSAIMQTLAEKLAKSKHLGASVFISRPNGRNKSRQLFITIAYQLAVHIEDYCAFVTEKLSRDPELVNKGLEEQFKILIIEPFVEKKIGAGGHPWGIILDGLDELDEHRSQRAIIRLIAGLVLQYPDVPLLWAIASRAEPHICDTFDNKKVVSAYWKVLVPANSKEACHDVEHFLKASLERIQEDFPRTVPKEWPTEDQFSTLAAAASGLFVLADTAIRFIEDPRYANPAQRLNQVLSALNGLPVTIHCDRPLASMDTLYTSILESIPPDVWLTTRRVLGVLLYAQGEGWRYVLKQLGSISVLLNLDLGTIYASVNGCYSLLHISDPEDAYWKPVTFYHASFSDYLLDPTRSKHLCIAVQDVEDDLLQSSLNIWQGFWMAGPQSPGLSYVNRWMKYLSQLMSFETTVHVHQFDIMWYIHEALFTLLVEKHSLKDKGTFSSEEDKDQCFGLLGQLEDAVLCVGFDRVGKLSGFLLWLFELWEVYREELVLRGVVQEVGMKQVQFAQPGTCPARMQMIQDRSILTEWCYTTSDFDKLFPVISQLELRCPQLPVLACGSPGNGCLVLRHQANASDLANHGLDPSILRTDVPTWIYFVIPFPHSNFYDDDEHFLRASLHIISANHSQIIPKTWPSKEQFQKLLRAVSHHSVFGSIAIQFIQDSHYGNPLTCLDQLVTLIDGVDLSDDRPFIYVDALYSYILNSISPGMWPTTQQILGLLLYGVTTKSSALQSPRGVAVVLGIDLSMVYAALRGCSMIQMPPERASIETVAFHHHNVFSDYLVDPTRSKQFYTSLEDTEDHRWKLLINIWLDFKNFSHGSSDSHYHSLWHQYCSQYHSDASPSNDSFITDFNSDLRYNTHDALFLSIWKYDSAKLRSRENQDYVFHILGQLDFATICLGFSFYYRHHFVIWLLEIWNAYKEELASRGILHEVRLQDLQFGHLEWHKLCSHALECTVGSQKQLLIGYPLSLHEECEEYISGLQNFQQNKPQVQVLIGGSMEGRFALFEYEYSEDDLKEKWHQPRDRKQNVGDKGYYIFAYPEQV